MIENFYLMKSGDGYVNAQKGLGTRGQIMHRYNFGATSVSNDGRGKQNLIYSEDQESMDLYSRARAQEKDILYLREQIALASVKETQLLNEKYTLERKSAELRMALHKKQSELINSQANELNLRRGDLEVNLHLINELKAVDDDRNIFTSSILAIMAEYDIWPHVTSASSLSSGIKHLHDELQMKIRTSNARLAELNSMIANNARNGFHDKAIPSFRHMHDQQRSHMNAEQFSVHRHSETTENAPGYVQANIPNREKGSTMSDDLWHLPNNEELLRKLPDNDRKMGGHTADNSLNGIRSDQNTTDQFSHPPVMHDTIDSVGSPMLERFDSFESEEEVPGIEGLQIIGDAKPGNNLLGCGYPVRGTSLCIFQWIRQYPDGTSQYIEGATNPDYVVTADDVDAFISVECVPMDELGRQGDIVRVFANDNKKITCDGEMQDEIDDYISQGQATFKVLILPENSEKWEPATLSLMRSSFQIEVDKNTIISEKYSKDLLIKIPTGLSAQLILTCSNGSSYRLSTNNDMRMRDTVVLTTRIFQSKASNQGRKNEAGPIST